MKNIIFSSVIVAVSAIVFSGCAIHPTRAAVFSNTTSPYMATSAKAGGKVGESEKCTNILGIIATGDCSISNAAKNGHISTVSTVDWQGSNFLMIFSSGKTVVTGE